MGMNPACSSPNSDKTRQALAKLDWLVASDLWMTETMEFWKAPGVDSSKINTEVFVLPARGSFEKEGSVTNSSRWMQWRYKAADGPGEAEDDLWIANKLMLKLKELYAKDGGPNAEAITKLTWNYSDPADPHKVATPLTKLTVGLGFSQSVQFAQFYRSLEAYRSSFRSKGDVLVIEPNAEFFKYLKSTGKGK